MERKNLSFRDLIAPICSKHLLGPHTRKRRACEKLNCGYLNHCHTNFDISWRTFCSISTAQSICPLPYNPPNHYVN